MTRELSASLCQGNGQPPKLAIVRARPSSSAPNMLTEAQFLCFGFSTASAAWEQSLVAGMLTRTRLTRVNIAEVPQYFRYRSGYRAGVLAVGPPFLS